MLGLLSSSAWYRAKERKYSSYWMKDFSAPRSSWNFSCASGPWPLLESIVIIQIPPVKYRFTSAEKLFEQVSFLWKSKPDRWLKDKWVIWTNTNRTSALPPRPLPAPGPGWCWGHRAPASPGSPAPPAWTPGSRTRPWRRGSRGSRGSAGWPGGSHRPRGRPPPAGRRGRAEGAGRGGRAGCGGGPALTTGPGQSGPPGRTCWDLQTRP